VLTLVVGGVIAGFVATAGTQVMVAVTGTDEFCGGACHSMQWVAKEHRESGHSANRTGVHAGCHDCHIPKDYPALLWYKAKAGTKDIIGEMRGVISTEDLFKKQRLRMAQTKVENVITRYEKLLKLPHVAGVNPAYLPDKGYIIAVFADENEYVGSIERAEPSALDGYPVVVFPPNTGEEE